MLIGDFEPGTFPAELNGLVKQRVVYLKNIRIIANPKAGRGRGEKVLNELKSSFKVREIEIIVTRLPGQTSELSAKAVEDGIQRLIVLGGDGSIGEAANGLVGSDCELGIVPAGTGNDIARSLKIPLSPIRAMQVAVHGYSRKFDVGQDHDTCFFSVLGIGFPADVAEQANQMIWLKGSAAFFFGMYRTLIGMRKVPVQIELDDREFSLDCTSIMIQNTPYTGGGLLMAPDASMDDGLLDVILVGDIGKLDLMLNFPRIYWGGHLKHPKFAAFKSRNVKITSEIPLRKIFDGDLKGTTPADVAVHVRKLNVVVEEENNGNR